MNKPKIIGLTGSIASGKSTVSKILEEDYGAVIIDADKISRELCEPGEALYLRLKLAFVAERKEKEFFHEDGTLNRKALANLMFSNKKAKEFIESIMHQHIVSEMVMRGAQAYIDSVKDNRDPLIVYDAPLLIEAGMKNLVSKVIVVHIDPKEQLKRLIERNGFTEEEALVRINAQISPYERLTNADIIIDNNGSVDDLKETIKKVIDKLYNN